MSRPNLSLHSPLIGVGLRPAHFDHLSTHAPQTLEWIEVISENYMDWKTQPNRAAQARLQKIRQNYPVSIHGVSLNIGSTDPLNFEYLKNLKSLIQNVAPARVSDHLCWTGVNQRNTHDLLPFPLNAESFQWVSQRVDAVQNYLGREIALENVSSYLQWNTSDRSEAEFLSELSQKTGCKILLDVNNVAVNANNHGFDAKKYILQIPTASIVEYHLAGHAVNKEFLIDTHGESISEAVWNLFRFTLETHGTYPTLLERDENIPEWDIMENELNRAREAITQCI